MDGDKNDEKSFLNQENADVEKEDKEQNENGDESTENEEDDHEMEIEDPNKGKKKDKGKIVLKDVGVTERKNLEKKKRVSQEAQCKTKVVERRFQDSIQLNWSDRQPIRKHRYQMEAENKKDDEKKKRVSQEEQYKTKGVDRRFQDSIAENKKDDEKKKRKSQEEDKTKRFQALIIIVSAIVVIGLSIPIALLLSRYRQDSVTPLEPLRMFHNSFTQLEADFPDQTTRFWRILRNRAAAHLKNPDPKKPLVFMFTAGPSAHDVLECIARKLAKTLEPEDNKLGYIKSTDYRKYSSLDDAKKNLDDTLKQLLQEKTTVLIFDVNQLPVQSPLLFYEYCDNENAPFKRAAIIFTVRLPLQPDPSLDPPKAEGLVAKYLRETWGKQDYTRPDDIPPLVNRMTDTVVMVNEESNQTVERSCAK